LPAKWGFEVIQRGQLLAAGRREAGNKPRNVPEGPERAAMPPKKDHLDIFRRKEVPADPRTVLDTEIKAIHERLSELNARVQELEHLSSTVKNLEKDMPSSAKDATLKASADPPEARR